MSESLCFASPPEGAAPANDHWGALLAGRVLVECADLTTVAPRNADKLVRVREWQRAIMRRNTLPATERALAGRTLAALGDPRPEVMSLDGMHFCFVPPGPFIMGSREDDSAAAEGEKPQHTVDLGYPYFIARFPVTMAQWREYVQFSGNAPNHEKFIRGRGNEPVVNVSWHDAIRFCDYLTQAWRGLLPKGYVVTLPSEAEWEKAARGGERLPADYEWVTTLRLSEALERASTGAHKANPFPTRAYPWGETFDADKSNAESTIGETCAVGCYPTGFSPYGCEDMSGHLLVWTRSLWGKNLRTPDFAYPYDPDDPKREDLDAGDDVYRVIRGAWSHNSGCAFRYRNTPDSWLSRGFRVVLRSAPVP